MMPPLNDVFFAASKVLWALARPDHLLLVLLSLAALLLWRNRGAARTAGGWLLGGGLALFWLVALYPLGNWLLYPLETRFSRAPVVPSALAGAVVLGGGESLARSRHWQRLEVKEGGDRYLELLDLAHRYPDLPLLFAGGAGSLAGSEFGGARALQPLLQSRGLEERVQLEGRSRNTHENAVLARPLAEAVNAERESDTWLLVTSAFHMPRAVGVFRAAGWQIQPHPVDFRSLPPSRQGLNFDLVDNLEGLTLGVREWLGLMAYRLSGRTREFLPGPHRPAS